MTEAVKRFEVLGVDEYERTSGPDADDPNYHLGWFESLDEAIAYARKIVAEPQAASQDLCDWIHVVDHADGRRRVFSEQHPPTSGR